MATTPDRVFSATLKALREGFPASAEYIPPLVNPYQGDLEADSIDRWMQGHVYGVFLMTSSQSSTSRTTLCGVQETVVSFVVTVLVISKDAAGQMDFYNEPAAAPANLPTTMAHGTLEARVIGALDGLFIEGAWQDLPMRYLAASYPVRKVGQICISAQSFVVQFVNALDLRLVEVGEPLRETVVTLEDSGGLGGDTTVTIDTSPPG